jgi:CheY-like chemotaxis protein
MLIYGGMAHTRKILIVEDNDDCRYLLALTIKRFGYEVVEAASGLTALDQASATRPDLILMDLGLPGIQGDEATARLKANPSTSQIPVVIHTAFHNGEQTNRALAAGAARILHKPVDARTLQAVLQQYLPPDEESMVVGVEQESPSHSPAGYESAAQLASR